MNISSLRNARHAFFAMLAVALACQAASAREIEVPDGQATIQAAIDAAADGDTIVVAPGTYAEKLTIEGKRLKLASRYLASREPADVQRTVLDGGPNGTKKGAPVVTVKKKAELSLVGFTIQRSHHAVVNSGRIEVLHNRFVDDGDALSFESGTGVVRHNLFEHNSDDGIDMDGASAAVIEDNTIRENKDDGIEIRLHKYRGETLEIVIRRNVFEGNREDGLQLIDYPDRSDRNFRIERNLFVRNAMAAIGVMADGNTKENYQGAEMPEPVLILNNTLVDNHYGLTGGDNMVLLNNLFLGTEMSAVKRVKGDSAAGVNLFWKNGSDVEDSDLSGEAFISKDPKLNGDYKPAPGSPCIGSGAARLEYNGQELTLPRELYAGRAPDLGAYELGK